MTTPAEQRVAAHATSGTCAPGVPGTAGGYARSFLDNHFVYVAVSPRAHGLSVGINMNPDRRCNFDCLYCEVKRATPVREDGLDVRVMIQELGQTLQLALDNRLHGLPGFQALPPELLRLRHVALTGDGEPTLSPQFRETVHAVVHLRALGHFPFFKLVLLSNASTLDQVPVQQGLRLLTLEDELWLKLEAGTEEYFARLSRSGVPLAKVLENILAVGRQRPVVIQSLFPHIQGEEPPPAEIDAYVGRLKELVAGGARITLVQVYSAMRPAIHPEVGHLSLRSLSRIAHAVREGTGLPVEVF